MNLALNPCPFCGGARLKISYRKGNTGDCMISVLCNLCHARGSLINASHFFSREEAEEFACRQWNQNRRSAWNEEG